MCCAAGVLVVFCWCVPAAVLLVHGVLLVLLAGVLLVLLVCLLLVLLVCCWCVTGIVGCWCVAIVGVSAGWCVASVYLVLLMTKAKSDTTQPRARGASRSLRACM